MPGKSVVVAGAGGNIGSHLVEHLARIPEISRIVLIDRDVYEERNLANQAISPEEVGRPKALVAARRIAAIRPDIEVHPFHAPLESLPLAQWRADAIVACLDSRAARQIVNERAWRLGVPWVDSGVLCSGARAPSAEDIGWLARVNVYDPANGSPCLECAWGDADYRLVERTYPCAANSGELPRTGAPSALGALAAALAVLECGKLLTGERETAAIGRQFTVDTRRHSGLVTKFWRNPVCRFDHEIWSIGSRLYKPHSTRIADLVGEEGFALPGQRFSLDRRCPSCGNEESGFSVESRAAGCANCGQQMRTPGFSIVSRLTACLQPEVLGMTLTAAGLRPGDVVETAAGYEELNVADVTECGNGFRGGVLSCDRGL